MLNAKQLGYKIRAERERKGWSRVQMQNNTHINANTLKDWESGKTFPSDIQQIMKLCELFDYDADTFLNIPYGENVPRRKENADIYRATGLSDNAIQILKNCSESSTVFYNTMIEGAEQLHSLMQEYELLSNWTNSIRFDELPQEITKQLDSLPDYYWTDAKERLWEHFTAGLEEYNPQDLKRVFSAWMERRQLQALRYEIAREFDRLLDLSLIHI